MSLTGQLPLQRGGAIPTLSGATWSGHVSELRRDRLGLIRRVNAECGGIGRIRLLGSSAYFVNAPALVHEMLVEKADAFEKSSLMRYMLYPIAGEGLFTSGGDIWRRQRRLMAPIFQPSHVHRFADTMVQCALRACDDWRDGEIVDMAREAGRITMGIVGRALFDTDTFDDTDSIGTALSEILGWSSGSAGTSLAVLQRSLRRQLEAVASRVSPPRRRAIQAIVARLHGPLLLRGSASRRLLAATRLLDDRVQQLLELRRRADGREPDLLNRLLDARDADGRGMSDRQVRDEVLTLFVAGHETTAITLAWTLDLLTHHPATYERVQAEVDALGRAPSAADVSRLPVTSSVIQEALRLYPAVYFFSRQAVREVQLGGHVFPRDTLLFISPYAIHRRRDLWPEPESFNPERFLPGRDEPDTACARARLAYMPFGAGPRICVGQHFAVLELQLVLATLMQRVRFEATAEARQPLAAMNLKPRGGVPLRLFKRE
jgi:cytochrome P450